METSQVSNTRDEAAGKLRAAMVAQMREMGELEEEALVVAAAAVPRHLFAPGAPLEAAYDAENAVMVKQAADGRNLSVLSAPYIQVRMLAQVGIGPGMRVLEIGSGGYNAALIREVVGEAGAVTTIDIDQEIVDRARACLDAAGYRDVEALRVDGAHGVLSSAPFDRIVITARAWDVEPAWLAQLAPGGRMVVPLRLRGMTRSVAFDRDGAGLVSRSYQLCEFVAMQGEGAHEEQLHEFGGGAGLHVDDERGFELDALGAALHAGRIERWPGAVFELPDELQLYLMTAAPMAMLHGSQELVDAGVLDASVRRGVPALVEGGSFAYRIKRPAAGGEGFECGIRAHGPGAQLLADRYGQLLREWSENHRRRGAASIRYLPGPVDAFQDAPGLIVKRHGAVAVTWH
jgi:protein-L-isoaspartate(D-aspartate) O-methyltransferase